MTEVTKTPEQLQEENNQLALKNQQLEQELQDAKNKELQAQHQAMVNRVIRNRRTIISTLLKEKQDWTNHYNKKCKLFFTHLSTKQIKDMDVEQISSLDKFYADSLLKEEWLQKTSQELATQVVQSSSNVTEETVQTDTSKSEQSGN